MKAESNVGGKMEIYWGQSSESYDAAIQAAIDVAHQDLAGKNLTWFEVIEFRGSIQDRKIQFQSAVRVGYSS